MVKDFDLEQLSRFDEISGDTNVRFASGSNPPLGWLWARMTAAARRVIAGRNASHRSAQERIERSLRQRVYCCDQPAGAC